MLRLASAVICVLAQLWIGRAGAIPNRTPPIKWLINTGNMAGRWPPPSWTGSNSCNNNTATPNAISRMQMIRGGTAAVLVMPTGDGGRRCCSDGALPQFSLGLVDLKHGFNNLYPAVQPFPNWQSFVDEDPPPVTEPPLMDEQDRNATEPDEQLTSEEIPTDGHNDEKNSGRRRIINAVDAFLDDRGRILWVLDSGQAGEDACNGIMPFSCDKSGSEPSEIDDQLLKPKFVAIDVYTNQIIDVVSLSRVWRPGVSCFQYIVSVYLDAEEEDNNSGSVDGETTCGSTKTCTLDWPLVVIGDAGTNRVLVYTHSNDRFAEIILPLEEEHDALHDADIDGIGDEAKDSEYRRSRWPTPPTRDMLYLAPLTIRPGQVRLLITYHGCREVYKLRLEPSTSDLPSYDDGPETRDTTLAPLSPIIGTLAVLGRKPCRMVVLGTDRRRTDVVGESFADGGTTVYFRLENTNDIWSWKVFSGKKKLTGSHLYIDERDFRLVRLGRTCRIPVAISIAPATVGNGCADDVDQNSGAAEKTASGKQIRQIVWMLETNFVDHFAATADRMGANAKLQPLEVPLQNDGNAARALSFDAAMQNFPLRSQPANRDFRMQRNSVFRQRRSQTSKRCRSNTGR
ncbi:uncharacterized protein LOC111038653 [Myzus persicae]|uniref:uncharacterized protein LOC111038653 n=1 Tax=Myzus persicae TaxID=13164 RepID=UPI000B938F74|nr:uncharacterized protein LOC111038653 [Myzus persicae]